MRGLLFAIVILIVLAGVAFFFGWVQFRVPPGSLGVLVTKTGGVHPELLRPGVFSWHPEAILPTNATLYRFPDTERTSTITSSGELPSAQTYAGVLPQGADFSFEVTVQIIWRVLPESLPELVKEAGLKPDNYEAWSAARAEEISAKAIELLPVVVDPENPLAVSRDLAERVMSGFPVLEIRHVRITKSRFPDIQLYEDARRRYRELADLRDRLERESLDVAYRERQRQETQFQAMERYGELLSRYPSLLELFYLTAVSKVGPFELPRLPDLGSPVGQE